MHIHVVLDAEVALLKIAKQSSRAANTSQEFCQLLAITVRQQFFPFTFFKSLVGEEKGECQNVHLTSLKTAKLKCDVTKLFFLTVHYLNLY